MIAELPLDGKKCASLVTLSGAAIQDGAARTRIILAQYPFRLPANRIRP